ncbi:acetoacetate decarboxylase family protein [Jatrophihabitans sp. YIM 134969]
MRQSRRQRALAGTHAMVDGIGFDMPVNSEDSPALMTGFTVDRAAAAALLPGEELRPVALPGGRGLLLVTVIDYRTTDIGRYVEFSIAIACVHRRAGDGLARMLLREGASAFGQYVWDLPVSSLVSVKGGKGIWGMPKHQASLDFLVTDDQMSSQYDLDGDLCLRVTVDRPGGFRVPLRNLSAANYCQFRGMLWKSSIAFSDDVEVAAGSRARGSLLLGPHPRMDPLRELDIATDPAFVACLPHSHGILDDHCEGWFLTTATAPDPASPPEGLESVVDLPVSEDWLPAPTAAGR